ncbi:MAG: helix-turn-helix domain-containing protein [Acidiferrobacteraceae bacterium]
MKTLNLKDAAALLRMHPVTVAQKARAGTIPGAKPGKCWVFVEDDLAAYVRSLYAFAPRALPGDRQEVLRCHSTNAKTHRIGGSRSPTVKDAYSTALGLPTGAPPRSTTTR